MHGNKKGRRANLLRKNRPVRSTNERIEFQVTMNKEAPFDYFTSHYEEHET